MKETEQRGFSVEEQLNLAYIASVRRAEPIIKSGPFEALHEFNPETGKSFLQVFTDSLVQNKLALFYGSATYEQHLQDAVRRAGFQRPFGIALPTLSQDIKLILSPQMVFQAGPEHIEAAQEERLEVATEGPQVMMYVLDSYLTRIPSPEDIAANDFLFIPYIVHAHLTKHYPLETGERSEDFRESIREAFSLVRRYLKNLTPKERIPFSQSIDWIGGMTLEELKRHAEKFCTYRVEAIKPPGLIEGRLDDPRITPTDAVTNKTEYLHLTDRDLPKRKPGKDTPSGTWTEFGTNRWNTDHQLFGRYQAVTDTQSIQVDFKLDSSFFPLGYGFFHTLEITAGPHYRIEQHAITGQETGNLVLLAGEYNFSEETTHLLHQLATDKGTKPEVAKALKTILRTV